MNGALCVSEEWLERKLAATYIAQMLCGSDSAHPPGLPGFLSDSKFHSGRAVPCESENSAQLSSIRARLAALKHFYRLPPLLFQVMALTSSFAAQGVCEAPSFRVCH